MKRRGPLVALIFALLAISMVPAPARDRVFRPGVVDFTPRFVRDQRDGPGPPASVILIVGSIGMVPAYGCGVIVADKRDTVTILTAAHNLQIKRADFMTVTGERLGVRKTGVINGHDLALVVADRPGGSYDVARFADAPVGTRVHIWGPIEDRPFTMQDGVVRAMDQRVTGTPDGAFAIDCKACGHGDSGTGVFDESNRLLGIVTSAYFVNKQRLFVLGEGYRPDADVASITADSKPTLTPR